LREQRAATNQSSAEHTAKNNALFCCHETCSKMNLPGWAKLWAESISLT
jgi:hypothetical protein